MRAAVPTVSVGAISKLFATMRAINIDPVEVCQELGFDASVCEDKDQRVPLEILYSLWEATLRRKPVADAALLCAARNSPGDYGLVGFVAMNCATMGEAIEQVMRFSRLFTDEPEVRLGDHGVVELHTRSTDRLGVRMVTEASLAEVLNGVRLLTQTQLVPQSVCFAHPPPADCSAHHAFFGLEARFGQPVTALGFSAEQLALPLPKADASLGEFLRKTANEALVRRRGGPKSPLDEIRELIAEELQQGVPTLERVARRMKTSGRTFRRRLEHEGSTFRDLLDETRAELAKNYVSDRKLPLSEVAFLLGFSEQSAFHRAFKRWTNSTPSAYRHRS